MSDYDLIDNLVRLTNEHSGVDSETIDIMKDSTSSNERKAIRELCLSVLKALDEVG